VIQLPRRGKQRQEIPTEVVENLIGALSDLALGVGEGVAVPSDDLKGPRVFEKTHQASNYGRKLTDELKARAPELGELTRSTVKLDDNSFALALSKKEKKP